jgi:hypothetical protein
MTAHPAGAKTRSRVLQSGGDHHQAGHSRNIRRVRRCTVSKPAARAGIRSLSATRSVSAAAWAGRCAPRSRSSRPRTDGDQTVLTGTLADQAALYGVLAEIEALGLELLEVRRLPPR